MAEFKDASLWMKLAFLFTACAFGLHLFAMATPGWSSAGAWTNCRGNGNNGNGNGNGGCGGSLGNAVEAFEIIGFICVLVAEVLILCLVLLDELKGNKIALICFVVFALVAGLCIIVGLAIFGIYWVSAFSVMLGVFAAFCAIIAGVMGILEIVKGGGGGGGGSSKA